MDYGAGKNEEQNCRILGNNNIVYFLIYGWDWASLPLKSVETFYLNTCWVSITTLRSSASRVFFNMGETKFFTSNWADQIIKVCNICGTTVELYEDIFSVMV